MDVCTFWWKQLCLHSVLNHCSPRTTAGRWPTRKARCANSNTIRKYEQINRTGWSRNEATFWSLASLILVADRSFTLRTFWWTD